MSQTTYVQRLTESIPGRLSCPLQDADIDSKINALAMPAGVFVARDGADDAVKVPAAAGDVTTTGCGFVLKDFTTGKPVAQSAVDYDAKAGVSVMRRGRMWVLCETASTYGAQVFVRITSDGASNTQLGKVRNDADVSGSARATALPGCRFIRTAAAGLTEIEYSGALT